MNDETEQEAENLKVVSINAITNEEIDLTKMSRERLIAFLRRANSFRLMLSTQDTMITLIADATEEYNTQSEAYNAPNASEDAKAESLRLKELSRRSMVHFMDRLASIQLHIEEILEDDEEEMEQEEEAEDDDDDENW